MTPVQSTIKLKVKEKRNQYEVLHCCDSLALRKSLCIQIGYRYTFIISISTLSVWTFFENRLIKRRWNNFLFPLIFWWAIHRESYQHTKPQKLHRVSSSTGHAVVNHNSVPCYKNATPFLFMSTGCSYSLTTTQPWNEATQIPFHINEGGWVLQTILWNSVNLKRKITFYNSQMVHLPSHPFFFIDGRVISHVLLRAKINWAH